MVTLMFIKGGKGNKNRQEISPGRRRLKKQYKVYQRLEGEI